MPHEHESVPDTFNADRTPWEALGGEPVVRALADSFYVCMDTNPDYAQLRALHEDDLAPMQQKFFEFLAGWLGGPQLYMQKHGHPRLRMRHASFPVNESMRDQWLAC
ncbi:MAG: group II truncated hemoglobin, partial [Planctomycetaceae bacterium]|nr:group II truncated hemoglobin [Planctomycetaceae bacterium]